MRRCTALTHVLCLKAVPLETMDNARCHMQKTLKFFVLFEFFESLSIICLLNADPTLGFFNEKNKNVFYTGDHLNKSGNNGICKPKMRASSNF